MHPLDGPRFKVARAKAEIDRLRSLQDVFFENTKHSVVRAEQDLKSGQDVHRFKIDGSPPSLDWGVYIGEIAHNLRSALNQLVYQLALLNSANKPETVARNKQLQFPIILKSRDFKAYGKNMIKLLRPKHKTLIEGLQPYKRIGNKSLKTTDLTKWRKRKSPLFWLKEINDADKHRIIQVMGITAGGFGYGYWGERAEPPFKGANVFGILEDGAKFGESDPNVNVKVHIRPLIAFAEGCEAVRGRSVCLLLNIVATTVSEIVDSFVSEFK